MVVLYLASNGTHVMIAVTNDTQSSLPQIVQFANACAGLVRLFGVSQNQIVHKRDAKLIQCKYV